MTAYVKDERIVDLYTGRGDCRGCGECCGRFLPLTPLDVARLKSYIERHGVDVAPEVLGEGTSLAINLNCPFLGENSECMVYEARPEVCRAYRCDLHRSGALRVHGWMMRARVMDMREAIR